MFTELYAIGEAFADAFTGPTPHQRLARVWVLDDDLPVTGEALDGAFAARYDRSESDA